MSGVLAPTLPIALVVELVARPAPARTGRIARLRHEARNHTVERHAIVPALLRQENEVVHRHRRFIGKQLDGNIAFFSVQRGKILLGGIDLHRRAVRELALLQKRQINDRLQAGIVQASPVRFAVEE